MVPTEIYRAPELWEPAFGNEVEKGGHFSAGEQPELPCELRATLRTLR